MSYLDARGHRVPSGTDLASRQSLLDLSLSIGDIKTVSSQSAAQEYVNNLKTAGVTINADNCVYVDVNGTLRRWDGYTWADVAAAPLVRQMQAITPYGYKNQAGSWSLSRIGNTVLFTGGEIGLTYYKRFEGGEIMELGVVIPSSFRSQNEQKAPCKWMNGWGGQTHGLVVVRSDGSMGLIPESYVDMNAVDVWHTIVIPPMNWLAGA